MENGAKKKNSTGKHARVSAAPFLAPIWASNRFAGPFVTAIKARLKLKHSWYTNTDKSSVARFQNKLKRFFTHVGFSVFSSEAQWENENLSSLNSLLLTFYSPHYIEKRRNGGRGKIQRKREDPGIEAVRKWHT